MCQTLKAGLKIRRNRNEEMKRKRMWNSSSRSVVASEKEYEVADILLDLPLLFSRPATGLELLLSTSSWGSKRRRSALNDNKDDDVSDKNNQLAIIPLTLALSPSQSHPHSLKKSRRKSVSKNKNKIKEEFLKKLDELTQCKDILTKEIGVVRAYYNKILAENSNLKAMRQRELKTCSIEEGKTKIVTKGLKNNAGTTTVFPSQQHMSFRYPTKAQSCQVVPSKASDTLEYPGLKLSSNGLAVGRAMDPSSWPHSFELKGRIGVDHDNKCQSAEARRRTIS